ncbi:peptidoglycan DD-metalloendopeptidase family protein [Oceanicoccus sagamiensis]|uniref:Lipoprotein NlpD n=1 Tax=Oceanicoccus sagamiensis TaxID=716816 RepID=A0A1X9N9X0_9GAMM|nr:peptidoglycan DD-metalloendopeptidase family protein [Oceanicoccus sagamiensis]ARN72745.1 lipoprotein NlpD [Oceanicoccus sagamiensis]
MLKLLTKSSVFISVLLLAGCFGGGNYAPVVERQERVSVASDSHKVARGDTLYSIAWRYNLDFKGLARTNGIKAPYTIYPNQLIRLKDSGSGNTQAKTKSRSVTPSAKAKTTKKTASSTKTQSTAKSVSSTVALNRSSYPFRWKWPAKGKVIRRYTSGSAVHKGIDLKGKLGEPVHAANSGKVVYAGSGLVGYGNLLIIKHNEQYLSAYGHNSRLLVKEGELVKVGQKIAEFGDTGTDKVKLHFEIRRDGKPVNPLGLLPKG